jgi:hypothetical protein
MWGLTCAFSAYPAHPVRTSIPTTSTVRYASRLSIPVNPFVPEVLFFFLILLPFHCFKTIQN